MCAKYAELCIFIAIIHKEFIVLENWGEIVSERGDYEDLCRNSQFTNIGKYATISKEAET